ncbi:tau 95 subunit of transcription factor TFIIIC [Umbelopsis sp. WA50703]
MSTSKAEKIRLPDKEFLNVEYPGRVNNVDKALNNIGGINSLTKNHKENSKEIELKFRPNDPFSHGIVGNVVSTKNLVLKVTRQVKKSNPEEQVGDIKTEILGQIKKTCRFRGLADFQFLVPPENRIAKVKKAVVECDVDQMMQFNAADDDYNNLELVPPPLFTRLEFPFDYSYQQNPAVAKVKVRQPDGTVGQLQISEPTSLLLACPLTSK